MTFHDLEKEKYFFYFEACMSRAKEQATLTSMENARIRADQIGKIFL